MTTGNEAICFKEDNTQCILCDNPITIYCYGSCGHYVCHVCASKMRAICGQLHCPVCRTELSKVYFSYKPPDEGEIPEGLTANRHGICFVDEGIREEFDRLFENRCTFCNSVFESFEQLAVHMSQEHRRSYCVICFVTLKLFPFERRFYTREEFARHSISGDADDSSFTGHPLCSFCKKRFFDKDELYRHSTVDHFYCSFCAADGKITFYRHYEELRKHFRENHFLCEHPDCRHLELSSHVFQTEVELKSHVLECHAEQNRQARREAGRVAPDRLFDYQMRQGRRDEVHRSEPSLPAESSEVVTRPADRLAPCDFNEENFPSLEAAKATDSSASKGANYESELRNWLAENLQKPPANVRTASKQETQSPPARQLPASHAYAQAIVSTRKFDLDDDEFPRLPSTNSAVLPSNVVKPQWIRKSEGAPIEPKPKWTKKASKPGRSEKGVAATDGGRKDLLPKAADFPALSSQRGRTSKDQEQTDSCWSLKSVVQSLHDSQKPRPDSGAQTNGEPFSAQSSNKSTVTAKPPPLAEEDFPGLPSVAPLPTPLDKSWKTTATRASRDGEVTTVEKQKSGSYVPPLNFDRRKAILALKIREALGDNELLYNSFKQAHTSFCAGNMSVVEFYNKSINTVGAKALKTFIFELIALLPDIEKQQELYKTVRLLLQPSSRQERKIRQNRRMQWNVEPLQHCRHCGQMLDEVDMTPHQFYHETRGKS